MAAAKTATPKKKKGWEPPPRKYFGPKDEDGDVIAEETYTHAQYPKVLYKDGFDPITVANEEEHAAYADWDEKPSEETHPDAATILKNKVAEQQKLAKAKGSK